MLPDLFFDWPHADLIPMSPRLARRHRHAAALPSEGGFSFRPWPCASGPHFGGVLDSILGLRAPLPLEDERPS